MRRSEVINLAELESSTPLLLPNAKSQSVSKDIRKVLFFSKPQSRSNNLQMVSDMADHDK